MRATNVPLSHGLQSGYFHRLNNIMVSNQVGVWHAKGACVN